MKSAHEAELERKIEQLKDELRHLKFAFDLKGRNTVSVPENFKTIFDRAQKTVGNYFKNLVLDPSHGTITIEGQRYLLIRAAALSIDFLDTIKTLYADRGETEATIIGNDILFDISHTVGINDAKAFHFKMGLEDPISKLSAGPVHFAFTGWAFVEILPESNPSPDENFFLVYNHPYSFESDFWLKAGKRSKIPVCIMNSGYSSGWCEESFGLPLTAVEITCKARGDEHCTFIMAPPEKMKEHLKKYIKEDASIHRRRDNIIPTYFERKEIEEKLKKAKLRAERDKLKTEQLNKELERNLSLLRIANQELESFSYSVSHDLRAPIRAINSFGRILEDKYHGRLDEEGKGLLDIIINEAKRMGQLIDDLLAFSKLGKKELKLAPVDMTALANEALDNVLRLGGVEPKVKITIHKLLPVQCDRASIKQVFVNLISNAVKFSKPNPQPEIEIGSYTKGNFNTYYVKDNGIGYDMKYNKKLFGVFQRLHGSEEFEGTGIGLAIVHRMVLKHGGKVWSEGKPNEGAVFYFSLPMGNPED